MRIKSFSLSFGEQLFKALSDEARLRVLHLLHNNEKMCISDIERVLNFTQTKTSRHLIYLKNAGIVNSMKIDQWAFYSIKPEAHDLVAYVFTYMEKDPVLLKDLEYYETMYSNRELSVAKLELRRLI